jgi:hypothetical protein
VFEDTKEEKQEFSYDVNFIKVKIDVNTEWNKYSCNDDLIICCSVGSYGGPARSSTV